MAWTPPYNYLGLVVSGDLGPYTIYTSRRWKKVFFPRSPPKTPASALQKINRGVMRECMAAWNQLSTDDKQALYTCVSRLSLCLTPQALWYSLWCMPNDGYRQTMNRQARINLPNPQDFLRSSPKRTPSITEP